ncbi:hypothetical protein GCM10019059_36740 [Camelimonas fluminis]|uniref:Uncharacterized protein n=1 Tax=Camelimonas fluminis TaxID=1576911 RepID=A0ABV7UHY0_9HYPH|nr:hypothetical protein [Camelimonas fluminis]GHE73856.1 hypothetical protein GCM10019059_36740 [Camelimonas fluminis]
MSYRKSEIEALDDEFGAGWDFQSELAASNSMWDEEAETDEAFKRHQMEMLRLDPYMAELDKLEKNRRGITLEMADIDLMS